MIPEIWMPVPGFELLYKISIFGRVKSLNAYGRGRENKDTIMRPSNNGNRYLRVYLCNGKRHKYYIHTLMANSFLPHDLSRGDIDHKNGLRNDNHILNLRRATRKENMQYAVQRGVKLGGPRK